jgi:hypothetical protein
MIHQVDMKANDMTYFWRAGDLNMDRHGLRVVGQNHGPSLIEGLT